MTTNRRFARQEGFSLMELMVGTTIAMIATIVIIQVMSVFEAQRRSTTGSADAQTNGGIALYSIGREAQMAGFPMFPGVDTPLSCTTTTYGGSGITSLAPVTITDGTASAGVNASDSITIRYGTPTVTGATAAGATAGVPTNVTTSPPYAPDPLAVPVGSNLGCTVGDATVINTGVTCAVSTVTAVTAPGVSPITVKLANITGATSGANLACLGAWNEITYAVNPATSTLNRTAVVNGVSTTSPMVEGVANIQAQYGISAAANSNQVTQWVDASGATWAPGVITVANRNRIKAVRIAVIARNTQREASSVSTTCSSTTAATPTGVCAWAGSATSPAPAVDLSPADANWARYRYRVFETIIPLRNVIWSKDTL
jgi:type IV pilus assembly protein PilW